MADTLRSLTEQISTASTALTKFLDSNGIAQPTLAADSPKTLPQMPSEIVKARADLIMAARKLQYLAMWPSESIIWHTAMASFDTASLHWLTHYQVFEAVPLDGGISYPDLAAKCGVSVANLRRIMAHASTNSWFRIEKDVIHHSAISYLAATTESVKAQMQFQLEIMFPSASKLVAASETQSGEHPRTAFNLAFDTAKNAATWAAASPKWATTYVGLMKTFQQSQAFGLHHVVNGYDWAALRNGHVVDVGGNAGAASVALAKAYSQLRFTVQDLEEPIKIGRSIVEEDVKDRISFQVQDFLEPNQAIDVDMFLLRFILHDWPDKDAKRILQNLTSAMSAHTKLLVFDIVAQPTSANPLKEKLSSLMDMIMMVQYGAYERNLQQWEDLVASAGFKISRVLQPEGCAMSLLEIVKTS